MGYSFDFGAIAGYAGLFLQGAGVTLGLTAIAATFGLAHQHWWGGDRALGVKWARALVLAYVELIRNTPFIVQMFFIFFGLPEPGAEAHRDDRRHHRRHRQSHRLLHRNPARRHRSGAAGPARSRAGAGAPSRSGCLSA